MKFSSFALTGLVIGLADAKIPNGISSKTIQKNLKNGNTRALLRHARKLDQEEEAAFEITSEYNVQFNSCTSLQVLDMDTVENFVEDAQENGSDGSDAANLKMYKDYIIFSASNYNTGESSQYAIDIPTFVQTLIQYKPSQIEEYCTVCDEMLETCQANDAEDADADADADEQEDGDRKLSAALSCDTCEANCFNFSNQAKNDDAAEEAEVTMYTDSNGYTSSMALEWFDTLASCQAVNEENGYLYQTNEDNQNEDEDEETFYASFVCNQDGSGVEIGLFANEECTLYSTEKTFVSILDEEPQISAYVKFTKELVENTITESFSCMSQEFSNPYDYNENNEEDETNELCQALIDSGVDISGSCTDEDDAQDKYEYDENGNNWGEYYYQVGNNDDETWSTTFYYDITNDGDMEQVCMAIQGKSGSYESAFQSSSSSSSVYDFSGETSNDYPWKLPWQLSTSAPTSSPIWKNITDGNFDWETTKKTVGDQFDNAVNVTSEKTGLKTEEVVGIIFGALAGIVLFTFFSCCCCRRRRVIKGDPTNSVSLMGKGKRTPMKKVWRPKLEEWNGANLA